MAVRPRFDPSNDFVAARGFTFAGKAIAAGAPFDKATAAPHRLATIYEARFINVAPAKVEDAPADPVVITQTSGGYYDISAPWLDEPIRARGKVKAEATAQQLREAGEPDDHHDVALIAGDNGWFEVKAAWLDEAEKVHGEAAARERAAQLRSEGKPLDSVDQPAASVIVSVGDNSWTVTAPWLADPEVFGTPEAAEARQAELRLAGPPEGWEPPQDEQTA